MSTTIFMSERHLNMVRQLIKSVYPNAVVWAYGSRVNGDEVNAHEGSDLDLAVMTFGDKDGNIAQLKEAFSESNIPFLVDIVAYEKIPESCRQEIDKKHFILYN